jgi:type III secretory pathway component EscV
MVLEAVEREKMSEKCTSSIKKKIDILFATSLVLLVIYFLPGFWSIIKFFFIEVIFGKSNISVMKDWSGDIYALSNEFWFSIFGSIFGLISRLTH